MKVLFNDGSVGECAPEDELHIIRHTCAHTLAQAVKRLYPQAHFGYGPANENGFYYDIDFAEPISAEDLEKIEAEMKKIIKEDLPLERFELPREEALALFRLLHRLLDQMD